MTFRKISGKSNVIKEIKNENCRIVRNYGEISKGMANYDENFLTFKQNINMKEYLFSLKMSDRTDRQTPTITSPLQRGGGNEICLKGQLPHILTTAVVILL